MSLVVQGEEEQWRQILLRNSQKKVTSRKRKMRKSGMKKMNERVARPEVGCDLQSHLTWRLERVKDDDLGPMKID